MIRVYAIQAPGSELHGETFEVQDHLRESADARAAARVVDAFSWTRRRDVRAVFVAEYSSREALRRAEEAA